MTTNSTYDKLGTDVIRRIALELTLTDILNNCLTSKRFNEVICKNENFWHEKLRRDHPNQQAMINGSWKNTYYLFLNRLFITGDKKYAEANPKAYNRMYSTYNRIPRRIPDIEQVTAVATGSTHVALIAKGQLYTFGFGEYGELGLGNIKSVTRPTRVTYSAYTIDAVSCGQDHTAILSNRQLYTFGLGSYGQLGLGNLENALVPTLVTGVDNVTQVSCNIFRTVIIAGRRIYTFGTSVGIRFNALPDDEIDNIPRLFQELDDVDFVAAGIGMTAIITHGTLVTYTGRFNQKNRSSDPILHDLPNVSFVACGHHFMLAIANGLLYGYGSNSSGQLGLGDYVDRFADLTLIPGLDAVSYVACGRIHSAVVAGGQLYTFGRDEKGSLGLGNISVDDFGGGPPGIINVNRPILVEGFENVSTVACDASRTCIVGISTPVSAVNTTEEEEVAAMKKSPYYR